jgi:uncharacterized membrane protein
MAVTCPPIYYSLVEPERFEISPRQLSHMTICLGIIFAVGAFILVAAGAGADWARPLLGLAITLVSVALICVGVRIAYARAYTEITSDGFATRGLSGTKRAAWADVSAIKVTTNNGASGVKVWVSGRRTAILLGAPIRSPIMGNPDFNGEVQRIKAAWHQARAAVEP